MSSQVISSNESSPLYTSISKAASEDIGRYVYGLSPKEPLSSNIYSKTSPSSTFSWGDSTLRFNIPRFGHMLGPLFVRVPLKVGYDASTALQYTHGGMNRIWKSAILQSSSGREIARLLPENVMYYTSQEKPAVRDTINALTLMYPQAEHTSPSSGDQDIYGLRNGSSGATGGTITEAYIYLPFSYAMAKETSLDCNFVESLQLVIEMQTSEAAWLLNNARSGGLAVGNVELLMGFKQFSASALKKITASNFKVGSVLTLATHECEQLATKTVDVSSESNTESTVEAKFDSIDTNGLFSRLYLTAKYMNGGICKGHCDIESVKLVCGGQELIPQISPQVVAIMNRNGYTSGDSNSCLLYTSPSTRD